jgi:hypothetical protein
MTLRTEYTAIRKLVPNSSWVGAVYVIKATDKNLASLAWTTKENPDTAYLWLGHRATVLEDFNDLIDADVDGESVGKLLLDIGTKYGTKEKIENFSCSFNPGAGLLPESVHEKLATGGVINNNTFTYTWPPKGKNVWSQPSLFKDPNDEIVWAIRVFLRSLPQHYRDAIKEEL